MVRSDRPRALLDSSIMLSWIKGEPEARRIQGLLEAIDRGQVALVASTVMLAEVFKRPTDQETWGPKMDQVLTKLRSPEVAMFDVTPAIARKAAEYRTAYGGTKKTPDALLLATAVLNRCDWLITLDRDFPKDTGVQVFNLHEMHMDSPLPWAQPVQEDLFSGSETSLGGSPFGQQDE